MINLPFLFTPPLNRKKFHIRCDMEGISGVVNLAQVTPGNSEYPEAREHFMAELIALIEGLREGGAEEVSVYDEHWFGRNLDLSRLPEGVSAFCGKPPYRGDWAGGLDGSHAGMILHGLHSKAGSGHLLCHTYEPDFADISLNGRSVGEIGLETAIAGEWGVPLVLVIADSAGVDEARQLLPGIAAVATKISQSGDGAECFSLHDNIATIRQAAARIASAAGESQLFQIPPPITLALKFHRGPYLEALRAQEFARFQEADTLLLQGNSITALWAEYWQIKLGIQRELAAP